MYSWVVFLHVTSVLGFLLAHGNSAAVVIRLRGESEPARIQVLLDLSNAVSGLMSASALLLLLTGIVGAFMGDWWGRGWIWASLALLIAVGLVMSFLGRLYFERLRRPGAGV
jgi:cytochrome c biogenesis protein CcdA